MARPGPSNLQRMGRGPAQPITFSKNHGPGHHMAARPMKHGLYIGRPDKYFGRPVDLTGRPLGRPMCCFVLKGACAYADMIFLRQLLIFRCFFSPGFRRTAAFGP